MAETTRDIASRFGPAHGAWIVGRQAWWAANRDRLVALVDAGLSSGAIAAELGVTRNAVMGQVHRTRLRLARPPTGGRKPPRVEVDIDLIPLRGSCVYPHGDPGQDGFGFCRAQTRSLERPYCAMHERLCYLPPREMSGEARFALRPLPEASL